MALIGIIVALLIALAIANACCRAASEVASAAFLKYIIEKGDPAPLDSKPKAADQSPPLGIGSMDDYAKKMTDLAVHAERVKQGRQSSKPFPSYPISPDLESEIEEIAQRKRDKEKGVSEDRVET